MQINLIYNMKHLIIFEHWHKDRFKPLKYKEGDYAIYDKYVNLPGILVKVLAARNNSPYSIFCRMCQTTISYIFITN